MMTKRPAPDSPDNLLAETKRRLRRAGLRARKSLGQHFLVDEAVLGMILEAADLKPADTVIEVGPDGVRVEQVVDLTKIALAFISVLVGLVAARSRVMRSRRQN